jgi:hypothetical protein
MTGHHAPFFGSLASSSTGNMANFDTAYFTELLLLLLYYYYLKNINLLQYKCTASELWNMANFIDKR